MHIASARSSERRDTHIRVYDCLASHHEMRVPVWGADAVTRAVSNWRPLRHFLNLWRDVSF